jgi:hypothetical protein
MGNRIFRLNEIVRQVVREKLKELEEPIVRITIDSFRKILQEEKDMPDPFDCLKPQPTEHSVFHLEGGDYSFVNSMFTHDSGPNTLSMAPLYTKSKAENEDDKTGKTDTTTSNQDKILFIGDEYFMNNSNLHSGTFDSVTGEAAAMSSSSKSDLLGQHRSQVDKWIMSGNNGDIDQEDEDEDEDINSSDDSDEEGEDDVPVVTKEINGKQVYVFLEDDVAKTFGGHAVYRRDVKDDGESEAGDIIGFLDDHDEYWEAVQNGGKIVGFQKDNLYVPTLKGTTYPEWEKMEPKDD